MRDGEGETVVAIPPVVGIVVVRVQPVAIVIAIGAEEIRVAVRNARRIVYATALRSNFAISGLYLIRYLKYLNSPHQVSSFFESNSHILRLKPWSQTLSTYEHWIRQQETLISRIFAYYHLYLITKQKPCTFLMCAGQRIQGQEQNAQAQRTKMLAGRRRRNRRCEPT